MDTILSNLKKERKELLTRLRKIDNAIKALDPIPIQYMQWRVRALSCIAYKKHFCQTTEILECTIEEDISDDRELRKRYINALSVALIYLVKDGELKKFSLKKRKGDFYGLPEWFEEDGTPKEKLLNRIFNVGNRDIKELLRA